ncbi:MAG: S8 family serine peptidase [Gemmatimonadales bacterium]
MRPRLPLPLTAFALLGVLACGDEPSTAPTSPAATGAGGPSMAVTGGNGRHIVTYGNGGIPADFTARVEALGGTVPRTHPQIGVAYADGLDAAGAAALATATKAAQVFADPEVELQMPNAISEAEPSESGIESPTQPQTAFFFPRQWNMRAVGANLAWAAGRLGSPTVRVGILDTGLDFTHLDLQGRVDLAASRSFVPSDDALVNQFFPGRPNWIDLHLHGTHVGATVSSNAIAAAGVTSRVTLVAVKVLGASGRSQGSSVLDGIMYAASPLGPDGAGVDVINMSLGGTFTKKAAPGFVSVINAAFNYAASQGLTVVVSAGNSAFNLDQDKNGYKTYCNAPKVLCVSATGPSSQGSVNGPFNNIDAFALYSNFGRSAIDVASPGGWGTLTAGVSFVFAACSRFSLLVPVCQTGTFVIGVQGTSQAAPHVSGLAALLSETLGNDPDAIREAILDGADDLGASGTDPLYGKGRINIPASLGI